LGSDAIREAALTLHESSPSIDGVSRHLVLPFLDIVLIWVVPLFQVIAFRGVMVSSWAMSMLVSVKKKAQSLWDLDNFRGIHVLSFFRQWYAACCMPELLRVASCKVSELQQGFVKGRRMFVAFMALYTLIESRRIRNRPLLVTFIDVKKAFPTVCREILWQQLARLGVDDAVIRSLILLYDDTTATIRASDGFGTPFLTSSGTTGYCRGIHTKAVKVQKLRLG
jgi:hypothetical protein